MTKGPPRANTSQVDDLEIHYHDHVPAAVKGTAVFVHGSGPGASGYSNFKKNIDAFLSAGYRVIVPDLPGTGLGTPSPSCQRFLGPQKCIHK